MSPGELCVVKFLSEWDTRKSSLRLKVFPGRDLGVEIESHPFAKSGSPSQSRFTFAKSGSPSQSRVKTFQVPGLFFVFFFWD